MTIAELEPYVERALTALEWETARARWRAGLLEQQAHLTRTIPFAEVYGVELEPLEARLAQIATELQGDVTADCVPQHPLRSVPMDLITVAVVRRILKLPADFPILSLKVRPSDEAIKDAVAAIAQRWGTPFGAAVDEEPRSVGATNGPFMGVIS